MTYVRYQTEEQKKNAAKDLIVDSVAWLYDNGFIDGILIEDGAVSGYVKED